MSRMLDRNWRMTALCAGLLSVVLTSAAGAAVREPGAPLTDESSQPQAAGSTADPFKFTSDAALIMWQVQADKAADFEMVWRVIRQRAEASAGAEVRAIVTGLRIYQPGIAAGDALTYVFHIDPVVKGGSYSPTYLLFESKLFERGEADELFAKMNGALVAGDAISTMPLKRAP